MLNRHHQAMYAPEINTSEVCSEEHASRYRQIIGIYHWAIKLGQIDILTEVSILSQNQAVPGVGHLEAIYLIVHYLNKNRKKRAVFDPTEVDIDENTFKAAN